MPAKTNTAPTALGGTNNSPDEPASNRAGQDLAMPRTPRHSRATWSLPPGRTRGHAPGLDPGGPSPGSGNPEPSAEVSEKLSEMTRPPRHSRASGKPELHS